MLPLSTVAARLVPSADMAIPCHFFVEPGLAVFSVHVAPLSVEAQMLP